MGSDSSELRSQCKQFAEMPIGQSGQERALCLCSVGSECSPWDPDVLQTWADTIFRSLHETGLTWACVFLRTSGHCSWTSLWSFLKLQIEKRFPFPCPSLLYLISKCKSKISPSQAIPFLTSRFHFGSDPSVKGNHNTMGESIWPEDIGSCLHPFITNAGKVFNLAEPRFPDF